MDVIVHAKCLGNSLHPFVILTRLETGDLSMFNICSERFSGPLGGSSVGNHLGRNGFPASVTPEVSQKN